MAFLKKLDAILLCALLTSCEEVFTPDVVQSPVLCVNALVTAGDTIEVAVSKSRLYTDTASSATVVRDATVNIYANGQLQPAAYVPREDDEIKVEVESPTLGKALAKVTVPGAATITTVEWEASDVEVRSYQYGNVLDNNWQHEVSFKLSVQLTVADTPGPTFYRFEYGCPGNDSGAGSGDWSLSDKYRLSVGGLVYDLEPIFSEHIGAFESMMGADAYGFTFFTDRQFAGKTYTLHLQFDNCFYVGRDDFMPDGRLELCLYSISQSYYDWTNYLWQRENGTLSDFGDYGFGDPIWGYSNVSSGAGVVAAQSRAVSTIDLTEFIRNSIDK